MCSQGASRSSHVRLRSWRNALRQQQFSVTEWRFQVLKVRQRFLVFWRSFNSYVIFGFQTTIIIVVGQRFPVEVVASMSFHPKLNRWARSRRTVSTLNLSTLRNRTDTSTYHRKIPNVDHSEFSGIQTHDLCLVSDAPILPKNAEFKQWNVE